MKALEDLFLATSGSQWATFGVPWNFTGQHNPCLDGWEGVECTCRTLNNAGVLPYVNVAPYLYYYDDGRGVDGAPCHISKLFLGFSLLKGTLPASIGDLQYLTRLHMESNHMSGTLPATLGLLTCLQQLVFQNNNLTGTIPTSLGFLPEMKIFYFYLNSLTGPIPTSVGQLTSVQLLYLYSNSLSGTLPAELGQLVTMLSIALYDNCLTGAIPSSLGNLTAMETLILFSNLLTSSIPQSIGQMSSLLTLDLHQNSLSGSLPSSFGALSSMQYLWIYSCGLTGSIPTTLRNLSALQLLLLYDNSLSGALGDVFDPQTQSLLQVVDLSSNRVSGTLPSALFLTSAITTVALVSNCFTGTLPMEMCSATSMQVLALDGLHTADACQHRFFPHSPLLAAYGLQSHKSMQGTIPSCLFTSPNLTTLHLTGNGFSGSLPSTVANTVLESMSLEHNFLTGPIPLWVQRQPWTRLNLGYNRLSGTLSSTLLVGANSSLLLNVNRLSGKVPTGLRDALNITILEGNLFGCDVNRFTLPVNDPNVTSYECGSNSVDFSLIAWTASAALSIGIIGVGWYLYSENSRHESPAPTSSNDKKAAWMDLVVYFSSIVTVESDGDHIASLDSTRSFGFLLTALICVVMMPTYAALSVYYKNHSEVYTWAVSLSYLSGKVAATVVVVVWALSGAVVSIAVAQYGSSGSIASDHIVPRVSQSQEGTTTTQCGANKAAVLIGFIAADLMIVGGLNVVYVFAVTSGALTSTSGITALQILLGIMKGSWTVFALPKGLTTILDLGEERSKRGLKGGSFAIWLTYHAVSIVNNIVLPCIVVAVVDPNCFYNVIVQAPIVDASYTYSFCAVFHVTVSDCLVRDSISVVASYPPPFLYNYQCSSALLANYAAVYVYAMTFSSFVVPIAKWLMDRYVVTAQLVPQRIAAQSTTLLAILVTFGVVFPPIAIVVLVALVVETYYVQAMMARFVSMAESDAEGKERRDKVDRDGALTMEMLSASLWLLLPLSASFNAFFVVDILGGEVGWEQALGGALTVLIALPVLMWAVYAMWRRTMLHTAPSSTGDMMYDQQNASMSSRSSRDTHALRERDRESSRAGVEVLQFNDSFSHTTARARLVSGAPHTVNPMI